MVQYSSPKSDPGFGNKGIKSWDEIIHGAEFKDMISIFSGELGLIFVKLMYHRVKND